MKFHATLVCEFSAPDLVEPLACLADQVCPSALDVSEPTRDRRPPAVSGVIAAHLGGEEDDKHVTDGYDFTRSRAQRTRSKHGPPRPRASSDGKKLAGSRRRRSHRVVAVRSAIADRGRVPGG